MTALSTDIIVLLLRLSVVALLYLFILALVLILRRDLAQRAAVEPHASSAASQAHLLVLEAAGTALRMGQMLGLESMTSLGRDAANTIVLQDPAVSSRHALLVQRDGRWWLRDLQSTNGTLVNQQPVDDEVALEGGDVIELGRVRLKLVL